MLKIRITNPNGKIEEYKGPSSWEEITPKQLRIWAKICLLKAKVNEVLKAASFLFFGIKQKHFEVLSHDQHDQIHQKIKFLLKNNCNNWVITRFRFLFTSYYGPANKLSNLTVNEYRLTELYYQMYIKSKDAKYLDNLIATLYRPKRKGKMSDDIREDCTDFDVAKRSKKFKWLRGAFKYAILFNYEGCRYFIQEHPKYKKIFKKGAAGKEESLFDYDVMIQSIAGGIFGNYKETGNTNLYTFLNHTAHQLEEVERLKN